MKKVLLLIFLIAFGVITTSVVLGVPTGQIAEGNVNLLECFSIMQANCGIVIKPQGDSIDCPGGPTMR